MDWVEPGLRRVGVFLHERFIAQRWCLIRVVGFVFVGHGQNCFEWVGCRNVGHSQGIIPSRKTMQDFDR